MKSPLIARNACGATSLLAGLALFSAAALAQSAPSSDDIIKSLRPTAGQLGGPTRGIRLLPSTPDTSAPGAAAAPHHATVPGVHQASNSQPKAATTSSDAPSIDLPVLFKTGSADLTPQAVQVLDNLGRALSSAALATYRFRIEGHTDTVGSPEVNKALSEQRANAVVAYLGQKYGIAATRTRSGRHGRGKPRGANRPAGSGAAQPSRADRQHRHLISGRVVSDDDRDATIRLPRGSVSLTPTSPVAPAASSGNEPAIERKRPAWPAIAGAGTVAAAVAAASFLFVGRERPTRPTGGPVAAIQPAAIQPVAIQPAPAPQATSPVVAAPPIQAAPEPAPSAAQARPAELIQPASERADSRQRSSDALAVPSRCESANRHSRFRDDARAGAHAVARRGADRSARHAPRPADERRGTGGRDPRARRRAGHVLLWPRLPRRRPRALLRDRRSDWNEAEPAGRTAAQHRRAGGLAHPRRDRRTDLDPHQKRGRRRGHARHDPPPRTVARRVFHRIRRTRSSPARFSEPC